MKTLTILQPWASLWVAGIKQYETRSWTTRYRGPLGIHAGARKDPIGRALWEELWKDPDFRFDATEKNLPEDFDALPFGAVIAQTTVTFIWSTRTIEVTEKISPFERKVGDWSPGRYAWQQYNPQRLACPIPATGKLGLWNCPLLTAPTALT